MGFSSPAAQFSSEFFASPLCSFWSVWTCGDAEIHADPRDWHGKTLILCIDRRFARSICWTWASCRPQSLGDEIAADTLDDGLRLVPGRISYGLVDQTLPARRVQVPRMLYTNHRLRHKVRVFSVPSSRVGGKLQHPCTSERIKWAYLMQEIPNLTAPDQPFSF